MLILVNKLLYLLKDIAFLLLNLPSGLNLDNKTNKVHTAQDNLLTIQHVTVDQPFSDITVTLFIIVSLIIVTLSPHHRQENTAPQDQTQAQAYRTPRGMKQLSTYSTLHFQRQTG